MRITTVAITSILVGSAILMADSRKIDFSSDTVGLPPKGFEFGLTATAGAPGRWVVQADGSNHVLAQLDADATRSRFPVAVVADVTTADGDLSVRCRPISGKVDQACGLVWRYRDENNYYIVRANALEDNVVLYKVENGKRTDLPLKGEGRTYARKWTSRRTSGAPCESSQRGPGSRCTSTAPSCSKWRIRPSHKPARWAFGPRPTL